MVEDHGKLRVNVNEDSKFAPVNMIDILDASIKVACRNTSTQEYGVCDQYNQKTLQLTGSHAVSAKEMANDLSRALDGTDISFEKISIDEMKRYFEDIRQDQRLLISSMKLSENISQESQTKHDKDNLVPRGKYLTDPVINCILSYLELVRENQVNQTTSDLRKITGNDPISLKNFFKDNRDQFRGRAAVWNSGNTQQLFQIGNAPFDL